MVKWSKEQLQAIETTGKSLLVSAAAGSGKTATLSQRCVHVTCDDKTPCDVTQLLVVTFTEAAAGEMKGRIEKALRDRQAELLKTGAKPDELNRVRKQLALMPGAQVSTIHAFCAKLLRKHFQELSLDPDFRVLDESETVLLKQEIITDLFEREFGVSAASEFTRLIDMYADGNDKQIQDQVIHTYDVLRSLPDGDAWINEAMAKLREAAASADAPGEKAFFATAVGRKFLQAAKCQISDLAEHAASIVAAFGQMPGAAGFCNVAQHIRESLRELGQLIERGEWDAARDALEGCDTKLSGGKACADRETADAMLKELRKPIKKGGEIHRLLSRMPRDMAREIADVVSPAETFLQLVRLFGEDYLKAKRQMQAVDFGDLEHLTLQILKARDGRVASECRERYRHIMVDEFQDVNQVQWEILTHVASTRDGKLSNLFCVGDVKQSIYRFRMADPFIFLARRDEWKPLGQVVAMQHNYRSREPLLQSINFVFAELMQNDAAEIRYTDSERLKGNRAFPPDAQGTFPGSPVELHVLVGDEEQAEQEGNEESQEMDRVEREARYVAAQIRELMRENPLVAEKDGKTLRPLRYGDIAVLLRSAKFATIQYSRAMGELGIPCFAESRTGFFDASETNDLLSILNLLDNQQQDIFLAAVLRSPIMALANPEDCLARIRIQYRSSPFAQAVWHYSREQTDDLAQELKRILDTLARWRERSLMVSVADLLWEIISETSYLAFCRGLANGRQRVANVLYLHRCARQFSRFQRQGLFRFMQFLKQLQESGDLGQPSPGEAGNAVQVLTIHKSKGLEFPVVIVSGIGTRFNLQDAHGCILVDRKEHLGICVADEQRDVRYPSATSLIVKDAIEAASKAEELRVLYVAMTRAQEKLILVGSAKRKELELMKSKRSPGKDPCVFRSAPSALGWLVPLTSLAAAGQQLQLVEVSTADISKPEPGEPLPEVPAGTPAATVSTDFWDYRYPHAGLTGRRAANSVTGLSKADETPQPVSYDPPTEAESAGAAGKEAAARGVAVHRFMELLDFASPQPLEEQLARMLSAGQMTAEEAKLVELADAMWVLSEPTVGPLLRAAAGELVREVPMLDAVAEDPALSGLDCVMLRGRIDAVVPTPDGLVVVDYKTDRKFPEPGSQREQAYRKQMQLYRGAIERSGVGEVAGVKLVFLHARRVLEL